MKKVLKRLYRTLPFKQPFFLVLRKLFRLPESVYKHLHFVDNIEVEVAEGKRFQIRHYGFSVENEIFWNGIFGGWEKVSLSIWAELCESNDVIFDIGANTGVYSLLAKTVNPQAKVHAFEPVDRVFEKLVFNDALNAYHIKCVKKALSNSDGEATIYDKAGDHTYSVTVNVDTSRDKHTSIPVTIETMRLDTYIEQNNIAKIDLLKIDVETHEVEVLEGFGEYLRKFEPSLIIEILNDEVASGIEKIIADIGYDYFVIDEKSGIKKVDSLRKSDYFNFLICKPEVTRRLKSIDKFEKLYRRPFGE